MSYKGLTYLFRVSLPLLSAMLVAQTAGQTLKIQDATAVRLSLTESLSSATNSVDDPVRFEVTEDVKVGDLIAIPRGSTAVGHVVEVEPKRRLGRAGKIELLHRSCKGSRRRQCPPEGLIREEGRGQDWHRYCRDCLVVAAFLDHARQGCEYPKGY